MVEFNSTASADATPKAASTPSAVAAGTKDLNGVFGAKDPAPSALRGSPAQLTQQASGSPSPLVPSGASDTSSFSGLFTLLLIALFVSAVVMMNPMSRNALIGAGLVSPDSKITKMSVKAAVPIGAQLTSFPMVQQAAAAMGCLYQGGTDGDDKEMSRPLMNDSDDEEEEAQLTVNLSSLSRTGSRPSYGGIQSHQPFTERKLESFADAPVVQNLNSRPTPGAMLQQVMQQQVMQEEMMKQQQHHDDFFDDDDDDF